MRLLDTSVAMKWIVREAAQMRRRSSSDTYILRLICCMRSWRMHSLGVAEPAGSTSSRSLPVSRWSSPQATGGSAGTLQQVQHVDVTWDTEPDRYRSFARRSPMGATARTA
jgi:hypothetical protein